MSIGDTSTLHYNFAAKCDTPGRFYLLSIFLRAEAIYKTLVRVTKGILAMFLGTVVERTTISQYHGPAASDFIKHTREEVGDLPVFGMNPLNACPPLSQAVEFTAMFPADPVCSEPGCERPGTVYRFSGNPFQRVCPTHRIHMRWEDPSWLARGPCATCSAERIRTTLTSAAHWTGAGATSQCRDCRKAEIEAELGGCKTCGRTGVRRRRSSSGCLRCSTHVRTQVARGVPDADITPWRLGLQRGRTFSTFPTSVRIRTARQEKQLQECTARGWIRCVPCYNCERQAAVKVR